MMRLRILELPAEVGDVSIPFVLVIDRCGSSALALLDARDSLKGATGARGVLVFSDELDIET